MRWFFLLFLSLTASAQFATMPGGLLVPPSSAAAAWSPADEASLVAWYKADVGVTNISNAAASDGDLIKGWRDLSGNNNGATNFTGAANPKFKANQQNSLPAVRFGDGGLTELRADNIYTGYVDGNDTPMIWAMAFRNTHLFLAGIWFQGAKSGGTVTYVRAEIDGSNRYFCTRSDGTVTKDVFVDWPVDTNNWHVVVWKCTGTTAEWFHDGLSLGAAQDVNVGLLDNGSDLFYIGHDLGLSVYLGADIGEILIFNSASVNVTNAWTYLHNRWNTPEPVVDTCTTLVFTNDVLQNDYTTPASGNKYFGILNWSPEWPTNVCSFDLDTELAIGVEYRASIWTIDGSNNLQTQQGSGQFSAAITGVGRKVYKFRFSSNISLSAGTAYALVISQVTGNITGVEKVYQGGDTATYGTGVWDSGGTLAASSTRDPKFGVYQ